MPQAGYHSCGCCGNVYNDDGSDQNLYERDHQEFPLWVDEPWPKGTTIKHPTINLLTVTFPDDPTIHTLAVNESYQPSRLLADAANYDFESVMGTWDFFYHVPLGDTLIFEEDESW